MTELEPEPSAAELLFGDRIGTARAFTAALAAHGEERGLKERLIENIIINDE